MTKIIRKELEAISEIGRENVLRSRVWLIEIKLAEKPIKFTAKIGKIVLQQSWQKLLK